MPHINQTRRNSARSAKPAALAVVALLLACLGLAACGGSSTSSSTTASASGAGASGASGFTGRGGRFAALRECLQKNGITLPKRTPGQRPPGGAGGFLGGRTGAPKLPAGVTRAQYEAAIKKCGGAAFTGQGGRISSPAFKAAAQKFAACMRENGVNVPEPNTSGNGPIFNSKGLDTASAQFKAAESKCSKDLTGSFRRGTGGGPPGGAGAEPGGSGGAAAPTQ